jgi:hypothetical protein
VIHQRCDLEIAAAAMSSEAFVAMMAVLTELESSLRGAPGGREGIRRDSR